MAGKGENMAADYSIACIDLGITWCNTVLHGETEGDLLDEAVRHGKEHKGVAETMTRSPEFVAMIRAHMRVSEQQGDPASG